MGRILLRRLFVRRRGNLVSFFFFALLDGWTIELILKQYMSITTTATMMKMMMKSNKKKNMAHHRE